MRNQPDVRAHPDPEPAAALEPWRRALLDGAAARLAVLNEAVLREGTPVPALERLTRLARRVADVPVALIAFAQTDQVWVQSISFHEASGLEHRPLPAAIHSLCAEVTGVERSLVLNDVCDHPAAGRAGLPEDPGIGAWVGIPLQVAGAPSLGVLCAAAGKPRVWSAEQLEALYDVAAAVSTEIELRAQSQRLTVAQQRNAGQAHEVSREREAERHRAFSAIGQQLNTARDPREVAGVILEVADRLIGWDCCWLDICNLETHRNETVVLFDEIDGCRTETAPPSVELTKGCYTMRALQEGGFLILRSREALARLAGEAQRPLTFGDTSRPSASIMVVPIRLGTRPIGALSIQSYAPNAYDEQQLELLQTLADYCAGALERAEAERARDHLQEQLLQAQKMEAVGRLAGGVAHDFNNMLAVINGYCGLLLARVPPGSDVREAITQIGEAGRRATQVTRQLLTFSRKGLLEPMPIDLATVVHGMEKMLQRLIGEDIELTTHCEPLPGEVLADPGQIEQVVMNLVINSRDAMPEGGSLSLRIAPESLDSHFVREHPEIQSGLYAHLEVRDTGIGMTECVRQRIFEPFFTTKEAGKGTGLGLSTVFAIIRQCGGCIDVESAADRGTTFHLYFPLTEARAEVPSPAELIAPGGGTEVVLLVEDEPMVSRLVRQVLALQGYQVLTAHTGEEALRLAAGLTTPLHMLLTDVVMPGGMNGRELSERLRAARPEIKVLYMSGYTDDEILRAGLRRSEVAFIHKPFSPDDLLREVRRVLDA